MKNNYCKIILFLLTVLLLVHTDKTHAQVYGLSFYGLEADKEKRTGLDLSFEGSFEFKDQFELSFDLSFIPDRFDYFGYIFRIIMDGKNNYDLIHNVRDDTQRKNFCLIAGSKLTSVNFNLSDEKFFDTWRTFRVRFDLRQDVIYFFTGDTCFVQKTAGLKRKATFNIFFGVNQSDLFKAVDVPSMLVRNIRLKSGKKVLYHWPLNENSGNVALDICQGRKAKVWNPLWLSFTHSNWKREKNLQLQGFAKIAFDPAAEKLYIIGSDSLIQFSVPSGESGAIEYSDKPGPAFRRDLAFFDPLTGKLYTYIIDKKFVSFFDFIQKRWVGNRKDDADIYFWHHNKMLSPFDSSLYIFGGYGHHRYSNTVQKLNYRTNTWETVTTKGDYYKPRYLAGLGQNEKGDTAYIIGGYGSESGEQMIKPCNWYDLIAFSVKDRSFKKLYDLQPVHENFCFANSLVIDQGSRFYGLIFPQTRFNSSLQLIQGSLKEPQYALLATTIPYKFDDIRSFADLFFDHKSKLLLAVTVYWNEKNVSEVNIYSLHFPPNISKGKYKLRERISGIMIFFIILIVTIILFLVVWYIRLEKQLAAGMQAGGKPQDPFKSDNDEIIISYDSVQDEKEKRQSGSAIFLFGELRIRNKEGQDITKKISPLIRELFLLIVLNSVKNEKGISAVKIEEILWPGKDEKSARNNRYLSILKLREFVAGLKGCQLIGTDGYWRLDTESNKLFIDYREVVKLLNDSVLPERKKADELLKLITAGPFLPDYEFEWLDDFKSRLINDLLEFLIGFAIPMGTVDPKLVIRIAEAVFLFDPANEDAMMLKCRALISQGIHSLARQTYVKFVGEYRLLYGEDYKKPFESLFGQI